jgi:hypothetical protein
VTSDDQPEQLIFTDRHGRLILGDTDIPGVDFDEDNDAEIPPGVDIVKLPGVDVAVQDLEEDPAPQIVEIEMISTSPHPIHHPWRWRQWHKRRPQMRQ